ncbi:unnamed protein product [Macrosiphum euphorbiae]|uniref:Uncharacterized protein n=1 Tax=Macrosiphum euphorbiae TaxID=13131 RepID=A0AAV0WSH7_9HEMI|nr:unnamed protein product [Macrosiphum euphorbiae]
MRSVTTGDESAPRERPFGFVSLQSLPVYESHYCRKESSKLYLPSHYTLNKCYEMYSKDLINPVSRKIYEKMFHEANINIKGTKKRYL